MFSNNIEKGAIMSFLFLGINFKSLKLNGLDLYSDDNSEPEEIEFQTSEELRTANQRKDISKLIELHKRSPSSSDPACLLAEKYQQSGKVSEALNVLQESFKTVHLKSHVAGSLGKHYLFFEQNFLLTLYWFLRSAIAQRKKPYDWGTYIYLHAILSALNEMSFDLYSSQAKKTKLAADRLFGPGGVKINYDVIQKLKEMYCNMPDIDISVDLKRVMNALGF